MNKTPLKIGQTVYFINEKKETILPAVVSEEMIIKNLEGEKVVWKLLVGPPGNRKVTSTSSIGKIYPTIEAAIAEIKNNMNSFFVTLASTANKRSQEWYKDVRRTPVEPKASSGDDFSDLIDDDSFASEEHSSLPWSEPAKLAKKTSLDNASSKPKNHQITFENNTPPTPEQIRERLRQEFLEGEGPKLAMTPENAKDITDQINKEFRESNGLEEDSVTFQANKEQEGLEIPKAQSN